MPRSVKDALQQMKDHPSRQAALAEIHARPFEAYESPRAIYRQAFMAPRANGQNFRIFSDWCDSHNAAPPSASARHHVVELENGKRVIWERHHEFITLTWDCPLEDDQENPLAVFAAENEVDMITTGAELVARIQLEIVNARPRDKINLKGFDKANVCVSSIRDGKVQIVGDFKARKSGTTRFLVVDNGLDKAAMGAIIRRMLEIETYRMLALIGFIEAKKIIPVVKQVEDRLVDLTSEIGQTGDLDASRTLLKTITKIAGQLEAVSASSQYRMSATRAYYRLVKFRLQKLDGVPYRDHMGIDDFLSRRMAPAMRTCTGIEERIATASKKLTRLANLLRTRVDIQMEAQNNALLQSMNKRTRQQFRLQQTVEGLSIAAVSYYVVGLIGYVAKGTKAVTGISPGLITALSVPVVIFAMWMVIRRIRRKHGD